MSARPRSRLGDLSFIAQEFAVEAERAMSRFPAFHSGHEGWAVIKEELDELWEHVRENNAYGEDAREEAIQIGAMALRYVYDLTGAEAPRKEAP